MAPERSSPPHVVILGAGFGGLYAARGLAHLPVRVTVIDRRNHHLFQPMLYQVATAALNPSDIAAPIRSVLRTQHNAEVMLAGATGIDVASREVQLADDAIKTVKYDYLIVAPGARHSYFGHDEWESLAPGLKSLEDAHEIRRRILLAFERAELEPDPVKRQADLTFVVVGGGPTGVEMAGAVAEIRRYPLRRDFRRIDSRDATVMLLEGGRRLLAAYPEKLSDAAKEVLRRLGVDVRLETLVTEITPGYVHAAGWTIPTHTVIWAAGNTASPILHTLGAPLDRQGRIMVELDATIPEHPEVFVIGDAANFTHDEHGTLPGIAPVAIQMGQYVARTIESDLAGRPRTAFHYWDKGQLAVIGRGEAVADIWRLHFSGVIAWFTWIFVHILYLIGFRNRIMVLLQWAWSYITYGLGARLITEEYHPNDALARSGEGAGDGAGIPGMRRHRPAPDPAR